MSTYIKLSDLSYPWHEGDIRIDHPEIPEELTGDSFPSVSDYAAVEYDAVPEFDYENQRCDQQAPTLRNGVWVVSWKIRLATQIEKDELQKIILAQQERITGMTQP